MTTTDIFASYGAIIATLALGWQIIIWLKTYPKLIINIRPNMEIACDNISYKPSKNPHSNKHRAMVKSCVLTRQRIVV